MKTVSHDRTIRAKLLTAFAAVACLVALFVGVAIAMHNHTIKKAAQLEAVHVAELIAEAATDNNAFRSNMHEYLNGLYALRKRDFAVVDDKKRIIASANPAELGSVYSDDGRNEVGEAIRDSRTRIFEEKAPHHPEGALQVVVAMTIEGPDPEKGALGAVVLEYTAIEEALLAAGRDGLYLIGAAGVLVMLLTMVLGLGIARRIARPLQDLTSGVERIAAQDYATRVSVDSQDEIGRLGLAFNSMAHDLQRGNAELHRSFTRVERLNRVYAVQSGINALIVRVRDREELFREACRIAVGEGHFARAWVGLVARDTKQFRIVAAHGGDSLFFAQLELLLREKLATGRGAVARSFATLTPVVSNDVANDSEVLLGNHALCDGTRALAVLPLVVAGAAVGVLTLNADVEAFFDAEEMKLLTELAGNIAFAIDHIEKRERLDFLASYDELTGLANRGLFLERVAQHMRNAVSGGHQLAVGLIDLERFRNVNSSLDRSAGDDLLRQVAQWLTAGSGDARLVARIGGDQFAVVMPEVRPGGSIARLLEKMIKAFMDHPFRLIGAEFRIAAKGGGALFPGDGADADTLLKHAEAALKKAKSSGERYLFYTPAMTATVSGNLTLENQLRQALKKEEFVLHYQPKVDLQSGKLTSAEALIRWNDPRTGLVPPGHFIPMLEETGLILEVGRWALHHAIADYLRWRAAGLPAVRIAVNVSPLQLRDRGFVAEIEKAVGVSPDAAGGLELEITESVIMHDARHNIATLQSIRALGVTVAIDDFGTGFSSLAYLSKLPVDTLKIDRSFVVDMTTGPQGMALVSTVIKLAHSLKLKVVAEGVETAEQSSLLRLLGCDEMQGYLFCKPVPAADFEARFLALATLPALAA